MSNYFAQIWTSTQFFNAQRHVNSGKSTFLSNQIQEFSVSTGLIVTLSQFSSSLLWTCINIAQLTLADPMGARGTRDPRLGLISFIFMQFLGKSWPNNRLAPLSLWGSRPSSGKS